MVNVNVATLDGTGWKYPRQFFRPIKTVPLKNDDFYRQILGISALWKMVKVALGMEAKRRVTTAEVDWATK
jgi:hypothetical protein